MRAFDRRVVSLELASCGKSCCFTVFNVISNSGVLSRRTSLRNQGRKVLASPCVTRKAAEKHRSKLLKSCRQENGTSSILVPRMLIGTDADPNPRENQEGEKSSTQHVTATDGQSRPVHITIQN